MAFGPSHEYEVPVIQYVRSGRHDIAYQSFGSGDLDLVFTPNCVGSRRTSPIESAPAFDSATRAVQCASALQHAAHHRGLTIRAGLHTGEC